MGVQAGVDDVPRRSNENLCLHYATAKSVFHFQLNKQKLADVCVSVCV